jgi:uncharacterized membrane protein
VGEVLPYATPTNRHFSKLAVAAFALGLSGLPILVTVLLIIRKWDLVSPHNFDRVELALFYGLPLLAFLLGVLSLYRIRKSTGAKTGTLFAILAVLASIAWPLATIALVAWLNAHF